MVLFTPQPGSDFRSYPSGSDWAENEVLALQDGKICTG